MCTSEKLLRKKNKRYFWTLTENLGRRSRFGFFCCRKLARCVEEADSASSARIGLRSTTPFLSLLQVMGCLA